MLESEAVERRRKKKLNDGKCWVITVFGIAVLKTWYRFRIPSYIKEMVLFPYDDPALLWCLTEKDSHKHCH